MATSYPQSDQQEIHRHHPGSSCTLGPILEEVAYYSYGVCESVAWSPRGISPEKITHMYIALRKNQFLPLWAPVFRNISLLDTR